MCASRILSCTLRSHRGGLLTSLRVDDDAISGVSPNRGPRESTAQMSRCYLLHCTAAETVFVSLLLTATRCESGRNKPILAAVCVCVCVCVSA